MLWLTALFLATHAQAEAIQLVAPPLVDAATAQARGPHMVLTQENAKPNGLLLVSIGGTSSLPVDLRKFDREAAKQGYLALGIDYPNTVISTSCRESKDLSCFDHFRQEIVQGNPVSNLVQVDPKNSLEYRIESLVSYLAKNGKDAARWKAFLREGKLDWSKVVVVGHSQGSGHAAYLAKKHPLHGVILLAGPQDTFTEGTAPWLSEKGLTPTAKYYFLLHKKDAFQSDKQILAARVLLENPKAKVEEIGAAIASPSSAQIYLSGAQVPDAHMSVITPVFQKAWKSLLQKVSR